MMKKILVLAMSMLLTALQAQSDEDLANEDLAKKAQNPIANMISLPFQMNTSYGIGEDKRTSNVLNIQPVVPISLGEKWNLVTRTIIPIVTVPDYSDAGKSSVTGLSDITLSMFFVPKESKVIWGLGPIIQLPTTTNDAVGPNEFGLGPSLILVLMKGKWVYGGTMNNVWSIGNTNLNQFLLQYFINYNLPKSWYLSSAPIITANWKAEAGNKWVVPFGGAVGKIFNIGKLPINAQLGGFYVAVKPEGGANWQSRIQVQLLFPK